jgi:hypothetical protein
MCFFKYMMYVCMYICMHVCIYYVCVCMYVCVCVCVCIHENAAIYVNLYKLYFKQIVKYTYIELLCEFFPTR